MPYAVASSLACRPIAHPARARMPGAAPRVSRRLRTLAALACTVLAGCGAAPGVAGRAPSAAGPPRPALDSVAGGPNLFGCWGGGLLTVHRPLRAEDWRFPAEGQPLLVGARGERPAADGCGPARTTVREVPADVGDGRLVSVMPEAIALTANGREIWRRATTGALNDAIVYRGLVVAIGPHGLFRWTAERGGEPVPVPLPPALVGRDWRALLREGETFWLTDADGLSVRLAPTTTTFEAVRVVGEPARLLPADLGLRAPVVGGRVEATLGGEGVRLLDERGLLAGLVATPPVRALLPLPGGRRLLVAGPDTLWVVRVDGDVAHAAIEVSWPTGGPTARLFDLGGRIVAVGAYGILTLEPGT